MSLIVSRTVGASPRMVVLLNHLFARNTRLSPSRSSSCSPFSFSQQQHKQHFHVSSHSSPSSYSPIAENPSRAYWTDNSSANNNNHIQLQASSASNLTLNNSKRTIHVMAKNNFKSIPEFPEDSVFHLVGQFKKDPHPQKVNLSIGAYRDDSGKPWVLPVVRKAELMIQKKLEDHTFDHEYLQIAGDDKYVKLSMELVLGANSPALKEKRAMGVQTVSGTGALFLAAKFLSQYTKCSKTVLLPNPTWGNHTKIFENVGFKVDKYAYYEDNKIDFSGMVQCLQDAPDSSIVVLHGCAHNPTGMDPTPEQWTKIALTCKAKGHIVIFDIAYQGFASGDPDRDAFSVRHFVEEHGMSCFVAQSYSKNFGLYSERVGCLTVVEQDELTTRNIISHLKGVIRATWSNPPAHGARVVSLILEDPSLRAEWMANLNTMSSRLKSIRQRLYDELLKRGLKWDHVLQQIGMFSFTGLTEPQVEYIMRKYHIYLLSTGRISLCGITDANVVYVADAFADAVEKSKEKNFPELIAALQ